MKIIVLSLVIFSCSGCAALQIEHGKIYAKDTNKPASVDDKNYKETKPHIFINGKKFYLKFSF